MEEETRANPDDTTASEENIEAIDIKELFHRALRNFKTEHLIICILIFCILVAIADRQSIISKCNDYWVAELQKCLSPKDLYIPLP